MEQQEALTAHTTTVDEAFLDQVERTPENAQALIASTSPPSDAAFFWNQVLLDAMLADSLIPIATNRNQDGPTRASRAAAIVHLAIHDAVNGVSRRYLPYLIQDRAPTGASPDAAAAAAAHATLIGLYPSQKTTLFDPRLAQYLNTLPSGASRDLGVQFGTEVGNMFLMVRQNDGRNLPDPPYLEKPTPGEYQADIIPPIEPVLTPGWGSIRPFTLSSGTQFRPVGYPLMTTSSYTSAFNEVKTSGSAAAHNPPTPETEIARFWSYDDLLGTTIRLYNQNVREILTQVPRNPPSTSTTILHVHARIFALVNVAMADAGIACWDAKYAYNFWRPIHGIRRANEDSNSNTQQDQNWVPLGRPKAPAPNKTPAFPAYVSGHSSFGTANFAMLRKIYGANNVSFTLTSEEVANSRSFTSFQEAINENGQSRIYLGVHWQFDNTRGKTLGQQITDHIWPNFLRPVS